jgi:DNA-binding response OmpR family regulator
VTEATILIVELHQGQGRLPPEWLAKEGYHVLISTTADGAVTQVHENHVSLVLLDMDVPGPNGWDCLRRIMEVCEMPVIVVAGGPGGGNVAKALNMGVDDYIIKPFQCQVLLARIRAVLRRYPNGRDRHNDRLRDR